jgi:hypothetical protein
LCGMSGSLLFHPLSLNMRLHGHALRHEITGHRTVLRLPLSVSLDIEKMTDWKPNVKGDLRVSTSTYSTVFSMDKNKNSTRLE